MKKSKKSIVTSAVISFFLFYIISMVILSFIMAESMRANMELGIQIATTSLRNLAKTSSAESFDTQTRQLKPAAAPLLYRSLGEMQKDLAFRKVFIYAEANQTPDSYVAKSGNFLLISNPGVTQGTLPPEVEYCVIDLEKCMDAQQIKQLSKILYDTGLFQATVSGYYKNGVIMPETLEIYNKSNQGLCLYSHTFPDFDYQGGEKVHFLKGVVFPFFERTGRFEKTERAKDEKTYARCKQIQKEQSRSWETGENNSLGGAGESDTFQIESHGLINSFSNESMPFAISYAMIAFPFSETVVQLIPVYVICFIFMAVFCGIVIRNNLGVYNRQLQLEGQRKDMTNAIAHELKNPLAVIRSYSEALKENINESKKEYYLDVIVDETAQMDKMVLEFLNLSRLEANAYTLKKEEIDCCELTEEVLNQYQVLAEKKQLYIKKVFASNSRVFADKTAMRHVISNFISNAIYHTPKGKSIEIVVCKNGKQIGISVENEGSFIAPEKLPFIWDSFYKTDDSRQRDGLGTGLGLAIAKSYLQLHGAEYGCVNTNKGVKFYFTISSI